MNNNKKKKIERLQSHLIITGCGLYSYHLNNNKTNKSDYHKVKQQSG